jgi:glycosyltransferase involved in cell wall biosynthesis
MKSGNINKHKIHEVGSDSIELPMLINALCDEIKYKNSHILSIKNSLCWKITSPCRFIEELITKIGLKKNPTTSNANIILSTESNEVIKLAKSYLDFHFNKIIYKSEVVCFDVSVLVNNDAGTGIQRVVREIAKNIANGENDNYILVDFSKEFPIDVTSAFKSKPNSNGSRNVQLEFGKIVLLDSNWDIFRHKSRFFRDAKKAGVEIIAVVYDIFPLSNPELCHPCTVEAYCHWFQNIIGITNSFLCISEATMVSLNAYVKKNCSLECSEEIKYKHWHLGSDLLVNQTIAERNLEPYLLMVSTVEPRKNYEFVIDAVTKMWVDRELDQSLIIVGRPGWNNDKTIHKIKNHPEYGKKLIWYSEGISDDLLSSLYNQSTALIQASINEGFGLAVVEASRYMKPIILSDIPVFKEIVLNNGYFFDLGNSESFKIALHDALAKNSFPTQAILKTWQDSTSDLLKLI